MAKKVAISKLNASTLDILNTIRANANLEYQSLVPVITDEHDIPAVGETLYGYPALANQFVSALVNRIALTSIKSATFNNDYAEFKKGFLEFGETVEEVFVQIAKAREFSAEKAEAREFKRTVPDVRSAFHCMNWRVQYPITIQQEDLRMAFTGMQGVQDLIARIVSSVYTAEQYDEFLLFKYLIIKAVSHGEMYVQKVGAEFKDHAVQYRGVSNNLHFIKTQYNLSGVHTNTEKADQYIFMDSFYNAAYDVNVLASAFNMDKAEFMGKLKLIDDWTSFDNDRFSAIRENSDMIEEVTDEELALMTNVKAVLIDKEWFQVYDNLASMSEDYVAAGLYWNYFYNSWKTVSSSPFSNAVVFVTDDAETEMPDNVTFKVTDKSVSNNATVLTVELADGVGFVGKEGNFLQTEGATEEGVAVHKYGAYIIPTGKATTITCSINGTVYETSTEISGTTTVGTTITGSAQGGGTVNFNLAITGEGVLGDEVDYGPEFSVEQTRYTIHCGYLEQIEEAGEASGTVDARVTFTSDVPVTLEAYEAITGDSETLVENAKSYNGNVTLGYDSTTGGVTTLYFTINDVRYTFDVY